MDVKTDGLLVCDLFKELREENNRLLNELLFEKNLNKIFENYRNYVKDFCDNCKCDQNIIIKNKLNELENDYKNNLNENKVLINNTLSEEKFKTEDTIEVNQSLSENNNQIIIDLQKSLKTSETNLNIDKQNKSQTFIKTTQQNIDSNNDIVEETDEDLKQIKVKNIRKQRLSEKRIEILPKTCEPKRKKLTKIKPKSVIAIKNIKSIPIIKPQILVLNTKLLLTEDNNSSETSTQMPFKCIECGLSFINPKSLTEHFNTFHNRLLEKRAENDIKIKTEIQLIDDQLKTDTNSQSNSDEKLVLSVIKKTFDCNFCERHYDSEELLFTHMKYNHSVKLRDMNQTFYCRECEASFPTETLLNFHNYSVHKQKVLNCFNCSFITQDSQLFEKHKRIHEKPFVCSFKGCIEAFDEKIELEKHIELNHKEFNCDKCDESFKARYVLIAHIKQFHSECVFKCHLCGFKSLVKKYLETHIKKHEEKKSFPCLIDGCDIVFKSESYLELHTNRVHLKVKPFKCKICDNTFFCSEHLTKHLVKEHKEPIFECHLCSFKTKDKYNIIAHQMTHSDVRPLKCEINGCDKTFKRDSHLREHQKRMHSNYRPFTCDWPECALTFKSKLSLNHHILKHTGDKPYVCDWNECKAKFRSRYGLEYHKLKHSCNDKPFKCESIGCEKAFATKRSLYKHNNSIHTN